MNMRIELIDECTMVDELAALKAQLAPLLAREEALKDYFKAAGKERYTGSEHDVVIIPATKHLPDLKKLRAHFGVEQFKDQWCYQSDSFSCKLTGRKLER